MRTNMTRGLAIVATVVCLHITGLAAQTKPSPAKPAEGQQHEHPAPAAGAKQDMSAQCHAMMAQHDKMMTEMKAADQRVDGLVAKMTSASGQAKVDATAAVVSELVMLRKAERDRMMQMHHEMMSHMSQHMQAGGHESMANCPMMKNMGGMKH